MKSRITVLFMLIVLAVMLVGCGKDDKQIYKPGTYETEAQGYGGKMKVKTTFDQFKITQVLITENGETEGIGSQAVEKLPGLIVEKNSTDVDSVSGATYSSNAIKDAVNSAINQAKEAFNNNQK